MNSAISHDLNERYITIVRNRSKNSANFLSCGIIALLIIIFFGTVYKRGLLYDRTIDVIRPTCENLGHCWGALHYSCFSSDDHCICSKPH